MAKGKYGKDKGNHDAGLTLGKFGGRRKHAVKVATNHKVTIVRKKDTGYAKKAKRRVLRTVAIPDELKTGRRRVRGKVLVASMMLNEVAKQEGIAEDGMGDL